MEKQNHPDHNDPETNRENQDHEFPGYPHHSPKEDILNPESEFVKADVDLENFSRRTRIVSRKPSATLVHASNTNRPAKAELLPDEEADEDLTDPEAEVTDEDLVLLGDPDLDQDGGDDDLLRDHPGLDDTDFDGDPLNEHADHTGSDLDLPDEDLGDIGLDAQDEENDYYSLGADKDSLEDDPS